MHRDVLNDMVDEVLEFDRKLYQKNVKDNKDLFSEINEEEDGFGKPVGEQFEEVE